MRYTYEEESVGYYWWTDVTGNTCYELMPVPLRGVGVPLERICADTLIDDNGDGVVDENDGLSVTSIAISQECGETILLVSIDTSFSYNKVITDAKAAIVAAPTVLYWRFTLTFFPTFPPARVISTPSLKSVRSAAKWSDGVK